MSTVPEHDHFHTANYRLRALAHNRWHRLQSKRHILRSQLGFVDAIEGRPAACQGCVHYHGIAYGQSRANRTMLICGFHPYGWQSESSCPDWLEAKDVISS